MENVLIRNSLPVEVLQGMVLTDCVLVSFLQAEDGIRDLTVTGVQTCALPIYFGIPTKRGPFLCSGKRPMEKVWITGSEFLNILDEILQAPIDNVQSAAGYLAGMYDAEGTRYVSRRTAITRFCQRPGPVLDRTLEAIAMLKLPFVRENPRRSDGLVSVRLASNPAPHDTIRSFLHTRPATL